MIKVGAGFKIVPLTFWSKFKNLCSKQMIIYNGGWGMGFTQNKVH